MGFLIRFCAMPLVVLAAYRFYETRGRLTAALLLFFGLTGLLFLL